VADGLHLYEEMALAQITREGLIAIAVLVAILWSCVLTERRITRNSRIETYRALRDIRYLKFKQHIEPAAQPKKPSAPSTGSVLG